MTNKETIMKTCVILLAALLLTGCAGSAPPPSATAIPWSPELLTQSRVGVATDYKADVATREYVEGLVARLAEKAACDPAQWAAVDKAWAEKQDQRWKALWTFEKIPNAPSSTGSATDIFSAIAGAAIKFAPLLLAKAAPAPLPPC
jgi:hypothetical protein